MKLSISQSLSKFALLGVGALVAVACNNTSNSSPPATGVQTSDTTNTVADPVAHELVPSGDKSAEFKALAVEVSLPDMPGFSEHDLTDAMGRNVDISRDVATLRTVTRIVETSAGTLDVYAGDTLIMILEQQNGMWMVRESHGEFKAGSIEYVAAMDEKTMVSAPLTFNFQQCVAEEKVEEKVTVNQEQTQAQAKETQVPAAPEEEQAQAQVQGEKAPVAKEEPVKEEPVKEEPKVEEVCTNVRAVVSVERIKEEVKQEQVQEQKVEEQKTEEAPAVEQKQAQEAAPAVEEKQAQEQAQAPAVAEK